MLTNFFHYFGRKPDDDYENAFVKDVSVRDGPPPRNRRAERTLIFGWVLIAMKCALVWWACTHYRVPIHPLWVVAPTIAFALLCTFVYLGRNAREL